VVGQAAQAASHPMTLASLGQATSTPMVTTTTPAPAPGRRVSLIKPNGRGGFDSSAAQRAVALHSKYILEHKEDIWKPIRPHPATQPTTRPALGR